MIKTVVLKEGWTKDVEREVYELLTSGFKPNEIEPMGDYSYWEGITFLCKKNGLAAELRDNRGQIKLK